MEKISGVYIIENNTGKFYIGSSKDIGKRWKIHIATLRKGNHVNKILQNSWNKNGEGAFKCRILEECVPENLLTCEQRFIDEAIVSPNCFNIAKSAKGGDNISNNPNKSVIVAKMAKSVQRRYDNMTPQQKKMLSDKMTGQNNPNYGKRWNDAQRENMSDKTKKRFAQMPDPRRGKTLEELYGTERGAYMRQNLSEKRKGKYTAEQNSFYGKQHSPETIARLREKTLGKYKGRQNKPFYIDDVLYNSLGIAAKELQLVIATIHYRIKSEKYPTYKYKEDAN